MALGAASKDILRMVLQKSTRLTLFGLFLGALIAAMVTRFLSGILFGVTALASRQFRIDRLAPVLRRHHRHFAPRNSRCPR